MASKPSLARAYYGLTKPGIIRGNLYTAAAGFFLAARGHVQLVLLAATMVGLALVVGSACVCNNLMDRDMDRLMERTRGRATVTGSITTSSAVVFATVLLVAGSLTLGLFTNWLTLVLALLGFVAYVWVYGYFKRRTPLGTEVGSISGAIPPLVGYAAVAGHLDLAAASLFAILVTWQMPHFYSIAIYRAQDYRAAGVPVLPVAKDTLTTKLRIMIWASLFTLAAASLFVLHFTGPIYLSVALILGISWLILGAAGYRTKDDVAWAKRMFGWSLMVISILCLTISLDSWIH